METLAPVRVTPEITTPIRPSEALRLGRLIRPRRTHATMFSGKDGACALGSIAVGLGFDAQQHNGNSGYDFIRASWPDVPVTSVWMKNDADATDEEIVAYLESLGL